MPALLFMLALATSADTYLVLKETKASTLQKDLDAAAARGYQVVDTFDSLVVLRRADEGRYAYVVAAGCDVTALEAEMNAAAAAGFRLVRRAAMGHWLIAIMEMRVGSPTAGASYRVLSFMTKYTISGDSALERTVQNRLDTIEVDSQVAELAVDGYRIVAAGKGFLDKKLKRPSSRLILAGHGFVEPDFRQELFLVAEKFGDVPDPKQRNRYHVLGAANETELQEMLNGAAAAGYRFLMGVPNGSPELIAIFEKRNARDPRSMYSMLATHKISTLQKEIATAARGGGFRIRTVYSI